VLESVFPAKDVGYFKTVTDAGVTAISCTIPSINSDLPEAITATSEFFKLLEETKNVKIVTTAGDIERAKKEGKLAIIANLQHAMPYERNLDLIRIFHKLGYKIMQLAYYKQNYLGAGCVESVDHGLTDRGREAIKELNRLGILIDTSHCGDRTALEAAKASEYPIAITHSTPSTLVELKRARSDETIKAVAEGGGVMGLVIATPFCERRDKMGIRPTITDFMDIIDYMVNLLGIDHVGFGFDIMVFWNKAEYDDFGRNFGDGLVYPHKFAPFEEKYVEGFYSVSDTIKITEELLKHGYSDDDAKKILGGNWIRLFKEVWK